ncbi:cilia- and flagella-associated protein 20-like [Argiope bruennichi]|uniref:Cilia- and flagella-associated protein 20 like protein n=1 Tax=Argiope bruennichi TaxID=94029 RepID=A0A8T0EAZ1_ARGBR|nr:cilia- and flagella-associated protein 20-like [Argiope bruennichi]KAF8767365.1 Cilia- and flagella-associated protein 20 like protein [Argiope bruennichi]
MVLPVRILPIDWRRRRYIPQKKSKILQNTLQSGVATIFSSHGYDPLKYWSTHVEKGSIQRIRIPDMQGLVLELLSSSYCSTYISAPEDARMKICCNMPIMTMFVEYLNLPFTFEFQLRDSKKMKRRYRFSTCRMTSKLGTLTCHVPLHVRRGWNRIQVDLQDLTRWTYNSNYVEFLEIQIYANCRLRRIFFSDKLYNEDELPEDYLLKYPMELHMENDSIPFTLFPASLFKDWNYYGS